MAVVTKELEESVCNFYKAIPMTIQDVCDRFDICKPTVSKILKKYGLSVYPKYIINNPHCKLDYFNNIDTQNKAYFLGLILTDGNVFAQKSATAQKMISITLNDEDKYLLEKFREEIRLNNVVSHDGRGCSCVALRSTQMAEDLKKYGIVERKSLTTYLPFIRDDLMRHMIRGIVDGDGSVEFKALAYGNKNRKRLTLCAGNREIMTQIRDYLVKKLGISNVSVYTYPNRDLSMVRWSKIEDLRVLYHYLYDDANVFMKRKKDKFDEFMRYYDLA